jgi:hypothetical protein
VELKIEYIKIDLLKKNARLDYVLGGEMNGE